MKNVLFISILLITLISCEKKVKTLQKIKSPKLEIEKIIVFNNRDNSLVSFKTKLTNDNEKTMVFLDNSIKEHYIKNIKPQKTGFYLKNNKNDALITLGIDNYYFYEIAGKKNDYLFITAVNMKNSYNQKDSLLLRKMISNYTLEYNGKKLDLNRIEKTNYISQNAFDEFIKRKNNFIPFKDSISVSIPKNVKIRYLNDMPVSEDEWDKL
jgi:hypothetical protein